MNETIITDHCIPANCKTYYGEEWINAEVVVNNTITHYIDGLAAITYSNSTIGGEFLDSTPKKIKDKDGQLLTGGHISLQSESHPLNIKT